MSRHAVALSALRRLTRVTLLAALLAAMLPAMPGDHARALAAAPAVPLAHAFSDSSDADFDLLGALRLLQGDRGLGGPVRPADPVTRAEFTVLVLRMRGLEGQATAYAHTPPSFRDHQAIPTWAWGYVGAAVHHGLIQGYDDGTFRAQNPVTLAEAAAMLTRLLGRSDEIIAGSVWPESYLELADRTGVSGSYTGYANMQLDRAGLAHLAANALSVPLDHPDSGGNLLRSTYGFARTTLEAAGASAVTTAALGTLPLADPYLWAGALPGALAGRTVDLLRLPSGEIAWLGLPGAVPWSPAGYLGYLTDEVSPRAAASLAWWRDHLAAETLWASQQPTATGSLRTAAVRLSLPAAGGGGGHGFVRVRGTTDQARLKLRSGTDQPWVDIAVTEGRFDQRIYFPAGRGQYNLQFMTPVPGEAEYWYEDLALTVTNRLTVPHDQSSGLTLLWPRAAALEVADHVDIVAAGISDPLVFVRVVKDGREMIERVEVRDGAITARVYLAAGNGSYRIQLCRPGDTDGTYWISSGDISFVAVAAAAADPALAPTGEVQSGNLGVHQFAAAIAGGAAGGSYGQAKAVYRWLGQNLAYDVARLTDPTPARYTTLAILARGKGVCQDYANVFAAMCRSLGIPTRIVTGVAPLSGGEPHAWNEFWDGQRWVSVDATWGAGYIRDGRFVRAPVDDWFDRDLASSHLREGVWDGWRATSGTP